MCARHLRMAEHYKNAIQLSEASIFWWSWKSVLKQSNISMKTIEQENGSIFYKYINWLSVLNVLYYNFNLQIVLEYKIIYLNFHTQIRKKNIANFLFICKVLTQIHKIIWDSRNETVWWQDNQCKGTKEKEEQRRVIILKIPGIVAQNCLDEAQHKHANFFK